MGSCTLQAPSGEAGRGADGGRVWTSWLVVTVWGDVAGELGLDLVLDEAADLVLRGQFELVLGDEEAVVPRNSKT